MANWKKLASGAAGAAGAGGGLNVEDVFSTTLYTGNGTSQTITNGLDLSTEGGLIWSKYRSGGSHALYDSERGVRYVLNSNTNDGQYDYNGDITGLNTDGYDLGYYSGAVNYNGRNYVDWVWRKSPKFFDIVTYTGNGSNGRTISHSLGCAVGMMFIKRTDGGEPWRVFHRSLATTSGQTLRITNDPVQSSSTYFNNTVPTDSVFTVGTDAGTNWSGQEYVAYLFAHNDGDGDFGSTGDQDIIKCGGWSSSGSATVNLGFEPQWIIIKPTNTSANWAIYDVMRGQAIGSNSYELYPNLTNGEGSGGLFGTVTPTATGFYVTSGYNANHIYMAIRRGSMAVPTDAADVFDIDEGTGYDTKITTGFTVDWAISKGKTSGTPSYNGTRGQLGRWLRTNSADYEGGSVPSGGYDFRYTDGMTQKQHGTDNATFMWSRAPSFFDIVYYTGNGGTNTIAHNLGVAPEMIWVKRRDLSGEGWHIATDFSSSSCLRTYDFSSSQLVSGYASTKFVSQPTATNFVMGADASVGASSGEYIAFLFATASGVSKVGSYTGNGTNQNIDCGFSSGARFVLVKATNAASNWQIAGDFGNGIIAGSDSLLRLDTNNALVNFDFIDPYSGGFNVTGGQLNTNGTNYLFYAVA